MKTVRVAAAVIFDGDRVFATRRGHGEWKGYWEFPGGKIEPGETPEEALCREIVEELDTVISVGEKIANVTYDYPDFRLDMTASPRPSKKARSSSGSTTRRRGFPSTSLTASTGSLPTMR